MYTAMHGVGYRYVKELLHHFHLPEVAIVNEQIKAKFDGEDQH